MEALKPETQKPEPRGAGYEAARRLGAASAVTGPGHERRADLLTSRGSLGYGGGDWTEVGGQQNREKAQSGLWRVPVQDGEVPGVEGRTSSGPAAPDEDIIADSAPALVEAPAPNPRSGGAPGCGEGPLGSWGTARLRCTPGREQARLCELGAVKNGWLPLHKRALLFGVPLRVRNTEDPPHQEKMKAYIAATTPRGYTKKLTGNGHIDGNRVEKCAQSLGIRPLESPSHPNTNQTPSCWNASDRDGERNMYEEKRTRWPPRSGFVQSNGSHADGGVAHPRGSPLHRTASAPCPEDSDPKNPPKTNSSFSSITITARRVPQPASVPCRDGPDPGRLTQAWGSVTKARGPLAQTWSSVSQARVQADGTVTQAPEAHPTPAGSSTRTPAPTPLRAVASGDHEPVVLRKKPVILKVTECQQAYREGEGPAVTRPPEFRHSYSEGDLKRDAPFRSRGRPRDPSRDVPAGRSSSSVLYLDKSLSLSLEEPEDRRQVHRSTLSLYLSGTAPPAPEEGSTGPRRAPSFSGLFGRPDPAPPAELSAPALKRWNLWPPGKSEPGTASDGPPESNTRTGSSPPLGDARQSTGDFEMRLPVCSQPRERVAHKGLSVVFARSPDPVTADLKQQRRGTPRSSAPPASKAPPDSGTAQGEDSGKSLHIEGVVQRGPRRAVYENGPPRPSSWTGSFPTSQISTSNSLTLREALELYRPDFISRSQGRVKELEERAQRRRAGQGSDTALETGRGRRRRNCTTPHPLSDNLFRPRERSISRKDMQLRSKRIYDKLPEVTRKKEEEKRRVLFQTNRLRAEIFKKKLLDQILQRNGD
ncbi:uncharacterized protein LOC135244704 isoform X1 [Anguilla rostrata]|uniref:uncharacterized protein LOC135244704 isoform X1 n=1 Tax=Anguilla rostrata TaxID=7938 RepID=UPI0030D03A31